MTELIRKFLLAEIRQGKCRRIEITVSDNSLHLHDDGGYSLKDSKNETLDAIASQSDSCTYCIVNYGSFSVYRYAKGDVGVMNRFNSGREPNRRRLDYGRDVNFSPADSTPSVDDLKQMARELCALYRGLSITVNGENFCNSLGLPFLLGPTHLSTIPCIIPCVGKGIEIVLSLNELREPFCYTFVDDFPLKEDEQIKAAIYHATELTLRRFFKDKMVSLLLNQLCFVVRLSSLELLSLEQQINDLVQTNLSSYLLGNLYMFADRKEVDLSAIDLDYLDDFVLSCCSEDFIPAALPVGFVLFRLEQQSYKLSVQTVLDSLQRLVEAGKVETHPNESGKLIDLSSRLPVGIITMLDGSECHQLREWEVRLWQKKV